MKVWANVSPGWSIGTPAATYPLTEPQPTPEMTCGSLSTFFQLTVAPTGTRLTVGEKAQSLMAIVGTAPSLARL